MLSIKLVPTDQEQNQHGNKVSGRNPGNSTGRGSGEAVLALLAVLSSEERLGARRYSDLPINCSMARS